MRKMKILTSGSEFRLSFYDGSLIVVFFSYFLVSLSRLFLTSLVRL